MSICALSLLAAIGTAEVSTFAPIGTISAEEARIKRDAHYPAEKEVPVGSAIKLFKVQYRSDDGAGPRAVSGLVALPAGGAPKGLVVYFQGTIVDRALTPSRYTGINKSPEVEEAIMAFVTHGYGVAVPDTFGIGDDPAPHPYPAGSINSRTGADIIGPARSLAAKANIKVGSNLFVTGYSEGGASALWLTRTLEKTQRVTRAAPISGPYDLSGTMSKWMLRGESNPLILAFKHVAVAYTALGLTRRNPNLNLEEYLVPSFASYVPFVFSKDLSTEQMGRKFAEKALQLGAIRGTERTLQPSVREALANSDESHPLVQMFRENDCLDWTPKTSLILLYVPGDGIVPSDNTLVAEAHLGTPERVHAVPLLKPGLTHLNAGPSGFSLARAYFDSGMQAIKNQYAIVEGKITLAAPTPWGKDDRATVRLMDLSLGAAKAKMISQVEVIVGKRQGSLPFRLYAPYDKLAIGPTYGLTAEVLIGKNTKLKTLSPTPIDPFSPKAENLVVGAPPKK